MLENMRRQGASIFVYLIFCLLIAIFIINFRPGQTRSDSEGGCTGESNLVVAVDGNKVSANAYHVAFSNPYNQGKSKQRTWVAIETLIRREMLAQEAEKHGLLATDGLLEDQVKKGWFFLGGMRVKIPGIFDENGFWNYNAFKAFMTELNVSKTAYYVEQKRGMLAWMQAQILEGSVQVSKDEALQRFLYEGNTASYDVVAFKPEAYKSALQLTDADVDRFMKTHEDDVKARYKADEVTYKGVHQIKVREVFVAAENDKPKSIDEAKAKLEAARTAITSGKQKLADAAKQLSTDDALKASGGDLGWRSMANPSLGEKAVSDAVKALKPGEVTPVIATDKGVYLVGVDDKREGDLSYDQVKLEIAKDLARDTWGKEAARRTAIAALEGARNGVGANLEQLYEKEKVQEPQIDFQKLLNDPNLSDEQKQQLLQELMMKQGPKHGWIEVPGKDILAAGSGDAAGSGSAAGSAAAAAPAAPPAPPAPAQDVMTPSKDELPKLGDVAKPHVTRYGPSPRETTMPGLGASKEAQRAVFEELSNGNLAKRIYEADGAYIVIQLIARDQPDTKSFEKDADQRVSEMRDKRSKDFLEAWMHERCETLVQKNKIIPNSELLRETDDKGNQVATQYHPCISFR